MPNVVRVGDGDTDGDTNIQGSPNVFANRSNVVRVGDGDTDGDTNIQGSPNVFANEFGEATVAALPAEYSVEATAPVRSAAGRYAVLDDPGSIDRTPREYSTDNAPPATSGTKSNVTSNSTPTPMQGDCASIEEPDYNLALSTHFVLGQYSARALFPHPIRAQNGFTVGDIICNLKALSNEVVEKIYQQYPGFRINSGFRTAVGGMSQHEKGMACDIQWPGISPTEYQRRAEWIVSNCIYDQFIFEHGNSIWLHVSFNRTAATQRKQILTMYQQKYTSGITNYYA